MMLNIIVLIIINWEKAILYDQNLIINNIIKFLYVKVCLVTQ